MEIHRFALGFGIKKVYHVSFRRTIVKFTVIFSIFIQNSGYFTPQATRAVGPARRHSAPWKAVESSSSSSRAL